jgi:hypothetical protein
MEENGTSPWWLPWVMPIVAALGAAAAALTWISRLIITSLIRDEFKKMLDERFREEEERVSRMHIENEEQFRLLNRRMDENDKQHADILVEVAYLRKRPLGD